MPLRFSITLGLVCLAAPASQYALAAEAIPIELNAGEQDRHGAPVFFELPESLRSCRALTLVRADTGRPVAVQVDPGPPPRAVWMLDEPLPAGQTRRYLLAPATAAAEPERSVAVKDDGQRLVVSIGGRPVLAYNHAVVPCPDRQQPWFDRSGFVHPLYSPAGQVLTDAMPPDHYHQHGLMFAWVNSTFEERPVDFWNSKALQGRVEHVKLVEACAGGVFAGFTVELAHVDLTAPGGPKQALAETWQVRVYNRTDGFLFDLCSTQRCASDSPLVINEYHYGGMAFRGAREWFDDQSGDFLTSEGKTRADGNHTRPCWVDAHGVIGGSAAGVTVFSSPDNFRFPQPVRLHPEKPYFCWSPMVLGPFTIEPAAAYVSKYRYYVHDGPLDVQEAETIWHALAEPLEAAVLGD
jgi:hypothetical protein